MKKIIVLIIKFFLGTLLAIFATIIFAIMTILVVIATEFTELYMYIFQREKYKTMKKETRLEKYLSFFDNNSLYY